MSDFFGAILTAIKQRKKLSKLTQDQLSERLGKDKTGTSKLLSKPGNWTIGTVSDLALALDLDFEFSFRDRHNPVVIYTRTGVIIDYSCLSSNGSAVGQSNAEQFPNVLVQKTIDFQNPPVPGTIKPLPEPIAGPKAMNLNLAKIGDPR